MITLILWCNHYVLILFIYLQEISPYNVFYFAIYILINTLLLNPILGVVIFGSFSGSSSLDFIEDENL